MLSLYIFLPESNKLSMIYSELLKTHIMRIAYDHLSIFSRSSF